MIPDPTKPINVVSFEDENLSDDMDLAAYVRTRDESLIKHKSDACKAAIFHLVPYPVEWQWRIDDTHPESTQARYREALLAGCRSITLPSGEVLKPKLQTLSLGQSKVQVASIEWIKTIRARFGDRRMYEIGSVQYNRQRLATEAPDGSPLSSSG